MLIALGLLVGLALALTGGGGSLLAVPMLVYAGGLDVPEAITLSLLVVACVAATGVIDAVRSRLLMLRAALFFIAGGLAGAPLGIHLAAGIPDALLLQGFGVLMILVAILMMVRSARHPDQLRVVRAGLAPGQSGTGPTCRIEPDGRLRVTAACTLALAVGGLGTGILSGLFGVGGGFLIVPALMFITRMDIHRAVASSLLVITAISSAGLLAALAAGRTLDTGILLLFVTGGVAGMILGRLLARRIAGANLQRAFACGAALLGIFMFFSNPE